MKQCRRWGWIGMQLAQFSEPFYILRHDSSEDRSTTARVHLVFKITFKVHLHHCGVQLKGQICYRGNEYATKESIYSFHNVPIRVECVSMRP